MARTKRTARKDEAGKKRSTFAKKVLTWDGRTKGDTEISEVHRTANM